MARRTQNKTKYCSIKGGLKIAKIKRLQKLIINEFNRISPFLKKEKSLMKK